MAVWDTLDVEGRPGCIRVFARGWKAADKIVYQRTLKAVSTSRSRLERIFEVNAVVLSQPSL